MQATNSLILKAVADAQKSVINHPPKITEPEIKSPSALFTRKYREKGLNTETVAITITNSSVRQHNDESSMDIDHHTSRNVGHTEMESDEMIHTLTEVPEPMGSQVELSFDAQPIETRFIVTLDGAHSLMSQRFEEELNEDETAEMDELKDSSERKPVKSRLFRRHSTGKIVFARLIRCIVSIYIFWESGTEVEVQQSLERCKFWPNCRQGDRCNFHHPKTPCKYTICHAFLRTFVCKVFFLKGTFRIACLVTTVYSSTHHANSTSHALENLAPIHIVKDQKWLSLSHLQ